MSKFLIIFFIYFLIFKTIILNEVDSQVQIVQYIFDNVNKEVGKKGGAIFHAGIADYLEDIIETERKVLFNKKIVDENINKTFEIGCGPWISSEFYIICEFNETIPKGNYTFQFNSFEDKFNYTKYEIQLQSFEEFIIQKLDSDIVDIYSGPQIINVTDDKDDYELKYNIISYNQEQLFIIFLNFEPLSCKRKNDELICPIKKTFLECYGGNIGSHDLFSENQLFYYNKDGKGEDLKLISEYKINYNVQKIDVYVNITKLLTKDIDRINYIAYETNVTNLPPVLVPIVNLFEGENIIKYCYLRKTENSPLLLLCETNSDGEFSIKEIKNEIKLTNSHHKYNFIIAPVINNEIVTVQKTLNVYSYILGIYPTIFDFSSKDTIQIDLLMDEPNSLSEIYFNEGAEF